MGTPYVRLAVGEQTRDVRPGGIVGRSSSAALRVLDPRISEAHAMVVVRGRRLQLLALRGGLWVDGEQEDAVELDAGMHVQLADGLWLDVHEVVMPSEVTGARLAGGPVQELWADSYALVRSPDPELVPGHRVGARAHLYNDGSAWTIAVDGRAPERFAAGGRWVVDGVPVEAVSVAIARLSTASTEAGAHDQLTVVGRWETAHLLRRGREPVMLNGQPAQVITELGQMGAPVSWQVLGAQLWPDVHDPDRLRKSFDRVIRRLRLALREHGIRDDLVRANGKGSYELFLGLHDSFRDEA